MTVRDRVQVQQGAQFVRVYTCSGLDLTGYTAQFQVRDRAGGALYLAADDDAGITIAVTPAVDDTPAVTVVTISVSPADFTLPATLPANGAFELLVTSPGGTPDRLVEGDARITPSVIGAVGP